MLLAGVLVSESGGLLMIPSAVDYRRTDITLPLLLSLVGIIIKPDGGQIVMVSRRRDYFDEACAANPGARLWMVEGMVTVEPVVWEDQPWLIQEAELFVLRWLRQRNDPEHAEFLAPWLVQRDQRFMARLGHAEYAKQYRAFWGRELVAS
jgi:hypothetical protein